MTMPETNRNRKGLTLMETTISIFIVSLMILACASIAVVYVNGRRTTAAKQQNVEEIGLALSQLAKEIRMSNCDTNDSNKCSLFNVASDDRRKTSITVISNLTGRSIRYYFFGGDLKSDTTINDAGDTDTDTILEDVSGAFYVNPAGMGYDTVSSGGGNDAYAADKVARITISITSDKAGGEMTQQTTVSMRSGYIKQ